MNTLKWFATISFLVAGILLSLNIDVSKVGFFLFLFGHILLIFVFVKNWDAPMLFQNVAFLVIDVIGIVRWWM